MKKSLHFYSHLREVSTNQRMFYLLTFCFFFSFWGEGGRVNSRTFILINKDGSTLFSKTSQIGEVNVIRPEKINGRGGVSDRLNSS